MEHLREKFEEMWVKNGGEIWKGEKSLKKDSPNWQEVEGVFGIAEEGAVWVTDYSQNLFLPEIVVITLSPSQLVRDIIEGVKLIDSPGIFIAGPSKTADVESFLVLGAHGPKRALLRWREE